MKKLFNASVSETGLHVSLFILRVFAGAFMLTHGLPKLMKFFGDDELKFSDPLGIGITASLLFAVLAEAGGSLLLILGLATRFAAAALTFTMLVIVLISHGDDPLKKEGAGLCISYYLHRNINFRSGKIFT